MIVADQYLVPVQDLTDEAFAPYGNIIKPRKSGDQGDRAYKFKSREEKDHVDLVFSGGEPCMRIMHQFKRGLIFTKLARHQKVSQCLGSLHGKEWFLAMAEATKPGGDFPGPEQITAFRIPGDRIIKIHTGVWHAGPHFVHDECMFMSLENVDTNMTDFDILTMPAECRILG